MELTPKEEQFVESMFRVVDLFNKGLLTTREAEQHIITSAKLFTLEEILGIK